VVSSTFIKQSILDGEMEIARHMMGRTYTIHGEVYPDTQRGTTLLNTPTSNIKPENELIPALGIYASAVELDEKRFPAATYIGTRPTFDGHEIVIETHIIGFSGKLYGKIINVELFKKTRDDVKFTHLSDLLNQIRKDVEDVKDYFLRHRDDPHLQLLVWPE
jgi:riboflavin kinase/FMN adenylyltransferase